MQAPVVTSPWLTAEDGAKYLGQNRSKRFVLREVKAGRLRAARIGGRGEILTRREWLDEYVEQHVAPVVVTERRTAWPIGRRTG
jgi:excisionase family DNA binding protein